jgi:hypothetical protein
MISIPIIAGGTALAAFAIWAKKYLGKPHKAEKREKAEIIKQLLALSEQENRALAITSGPARNPQRVSTPGSRPNTLRKGTSQQHQPTRRYSHTRPTPSMPLGRHQTDAKIEEKIRQRAYELYQQRGGGKGNPAEDWLQAKNEILSHKTKPGST